MPIELVKAYKCTHCGKPHLLRKDAQVCAADCWRDHIEDAREERAARDKDKRENYVRLHARTLDEIWEMLIHYTHEYLGLRLVLNKVPHQYSDCVSNTHGAPIGKPTNWHRKDDLPKGYPGWTGRFEGNIVGKIKGEEANLDAIINHWSSRDFNFSGFHTGTGCPGKRFGIGGYIFIEDFPKVARWWTHKNVANRLRGDMCV